MMKRQSLIALGIAIVLGLVAVYLANIFLTSKEQKVAANTTGTTKVAVATVPLDYGVKITPDKVRFVDYPAASLPPGTYRTNAELVPAGGPRVALRPMLVNEPILASNVSGDGRRASISSLLPAGMRAASVRINDISGVAGFIQPNDTVDVLITRQIGEAQVTDVLLQNIRVIAMGQRTNGEGAKPALARSATLEVVPLDAQKLALAQQVGSLSLVLRKPGAEEDNPLIRTVSMNDLRYSLYGGYARPAAMPIRPAAPRAVPPRRIASRPPAPPAPVRQSNSVEVVRGTANSQYEVGDYGS